VRVYTSSITEEKVKGSVSHLVFLHEIKTLFPWYYSINTNISSGGSRVGSFTRIIALRPQRTLHQQMTKIKITRLQNHGQWKVGEISCTGAVVLHWRATNLKLKGRALLFNASCNEQMFSSKFRKKNWRRFVLSFSRKTQ